MLQLEGENYTIRGESSEFTNRQKSLFDQLNAVEVKRTESIVETNKPSSMKRKRGSSMINTKQYIGKDSIFNKTSEVRPRNSQITDPRRHPDKWVKYSLSDVSAEDMSDKSNTAAAMAFLQEIAARKQNKPEDINEIDNKVIFKKPVKPVRGVRNEITDNSGEDGTSFFRGSKLVMPEYIIGKQKQEPRRPSKSAIGSSKNEKCIKLNHLTDLSDEDED